MKTSVTMDYFQLEISTRDFRSAKKEQSTLSQSTVLVVVKLVRNKIVGTSLKLSHEWTSLFVTV
jgi:hypothetical protein